jgi:3-isopropylmalate dehydrogenase
VKKTDKHHRLTIAILHGDGISIEIMPPIVTILDTLNGRLNLNLNFVEHAIGLSLLKRSGTTFTDEILSDAKSADGVILGPVSTYQYPSLAEGGINPSATLRIAFDLFANVRPSCTPAGVPNSGRSMDLVIVRENTEGFYADRNMTEGSGEFQPTSDIALAIRKITKSACCRIGRTAFELAGQRRKHVTMVHKANVLKVTDGLFIKSVKEVSQNFPEITLDERLVDAMAADLIRRPDAFDVVVTTNMYGDILSDEAAALSGGLGLAGALNAGSDHAVAQAVHGSAPDIAGQGIANPVAVILSAAMLLEWLSIRKERPDLLHAATQVRTAINYTLARPENHTPDLGGNATTETVARAILDALPGA